MNPTILFHGYDSDVHFIAIERQNIIIIRLNHLNVVLIKLHVVHRLCESILFFHVLRGFLLGVFGKANLCH
jgi:hypothetical protein